MAGVRSPRTISLASAGLLVLAGMISGTAVAVTWYAAARGTWSADVPFADPALPIRSGVETDGSVLTHVVPGGPAWNAGLRPGWAVEREPSLPGGMSACSADGSCFLFHELQPQSALAFRWWIETLAIVLVVIALPNWRQRPRLVGLLGLAALAASAPTYAALGALPWFPGLYIASVVGPPFWLRQTGAHWLWTALSAGALGVAVFWAYAWLVQPEMYDVAELARLLVLLVTLTAGTAVVSGVVAIADTPSTRDRVTDIVVSIAILGWAAAVWWFGIAPDLVAAAIAVGAVGAYLALRHRVRSLLARATFAELGQRATLMALEAERSRVARDLHDAPLQELTAVIHRLDEKPEIAPETARLREIADHLREVSISLRPPVLDDVGLGAALADLVDRHTSDSGPPIELHVADETAIDPDSRPPADVELAAYRIIQEAITNARRHSGASTIEVSGAIRRQRLRLAVTDNGRGVDRRLVASAERAGRLGVASMRERAAAIGAELTISPAPGGSGTSVRLAWSDQ